MEINDYREIDASQVQEARDDGFRLHHVFETESVGFPDDSGGYVWEDIVVRDEWYAATPEFVASYHQSGGIWEYRD